MFSPNVFFERANVFFERAKSIFDGANAKMERAIGFFERAAGFFDCAGGILKRSVVFLEDDSSIMIFPGVFSDFNSVSKFNRMKTLLIFLLAAFAFLQSISAQTPPIEKGVSKDSAKRRSANYSEIKYKLDLTLEKLSPVLKNSAEISLLSKGDLIIFDWRKLAGNEDLSKISNLSVNGRKAYFEEINGHLVLKEGVLKNKTHAIKFDFTSPVAETGAAVTRDTDKTDNAEYVYFLSNNTNSAFPVFDEPDLKARFRVKMIVPNEWYATSSTNSQKNFPIEGNGLGFGGRKNF